MNTEPTPTTLDGPPSASRSYADAFAAAARRPRSDRPKTAYTAIVLALFCVACILLPLGALKNVDARAGLKADLADLGQGVSIMKTRSETFFVVRSDDTFNVFESYSPHLGDPVIWCPNEKVFVSIPHSEGYALDGSVIAGPSARPLATVAYSIESGRLALDTLSPGPEPKPFSAPSVDPDVLTGIFVSGGCSGGVKG